MNKRIIACVMTMLMIVVVSFNLNAQDKVKEMVLLRVKMDCHKCEEKIMINIVFEKGTLDIKTDLKSNAVGIMFNTKKTDKQKLVAELKKWLYHRRGSDTTR